MATAPVDRAAGKVAARDLRVEAGPVADDAAATAAEVEDRRHLVDAGPCAAECVADRLRRQAAAFEKPRQVGRSGDPDDQLRRRHREPVERGGLGRTRQPGRAKALVGAVRGSEEPRATEEAEERVLQGPAETNGRYASLVCVRHAPTPSAITVQRTITSTAVPSDSCRSGP